jgi:hypothetical protein
VSVYREELDSPSDGEERLAPRYAPTPIRIDHEEHRRLREAAPADGLLPRTLRWFAALPRDVRPARLLRDYPRVANLIAATWRDSRVFDAYMDSLLTDKRGNRRGFPADVQRELLALAVQHPRKRINRGAR